MSEANGQMGRGVCAEPRKRPGSGTWERERIAIGKSRSRFVWGPGIAAAGDDSELRKQEVPTGGWESLAELGFRVQGIRRGVLSAVVTTEIVGVVPLFRFRSR